MFLNNFKLLSLMAIFLLFGNEICALQWNHNKIKSTRVPHSILSTRLYSSNSWDDFSKTSTDIMKDAADKAKEKSKEAIESLLEIYNNASKNSKIGTPFKRGEPLLFAQVLTMILLTLGPLSAGSIPFVGLAIDTIGVASLVSGVILVSLSVYYMGNEISYLSVPVKDNILSEGPYNFARHPLYGGVILTGFGIAITSDSMERMLFAIILAIIMDNRANLEEELLVAKFGQEYKKFATQRTKLIPFLI
jgi:protein-S-isoprenylcysteine O-methyltransferase Ste14